MITECFGETKKKLCPFFGYKTLDFVDFLHLKITDFFFAIRKVWKVANFVKSVKDKCSEFYLVFSNSIQTRGMYIILIISFLKSSYS